MHVLLAQNVSIAAHGVSLFLCTILTASSTQASSCVAFCYGLMFHNGVSVQTRVVFSMIMFW